MARNATASCMTVQSQDQKNEIGTCPNEEKCMDFIDGNRQSRTPSSLSPTPPPLPPHHYFSNKSQSALSLSQPSLDDTHKEDLLSSGNPTRSNSKEAVRVIVSAIDAQINSINEMLSYFTKLVKAEKVVQHALSDLLPVQSDNNSQGANGVFASYEVFISLLRLHA
ncbi:unnamed protein product [Calicophoron daubneyi]|uniref:Uncharacterized protein n=1 Tax=Calicophoron daubneyi TaxID=300641 RepID=A0AAV2T1C2_CALDB